MAELTEYASKGAVGAALGTGIAGLSLGVLNGAGGLMGLFGNRTINGNCESNMPITRYEFNMGQELAKKDSEIALLKSEQNTENKIADVYERIMTRVNADQRAQAEWNATQSVNNAQMSSAIATNANSIAGLSNTIGNLTKVVIPNTNVCPGWGNVQVEPVSLNSCGCNNSTNLY